MAQSFDFSIFIAWCHFGVRQLRIVVEIGGHRERKRQTFPVLLDFKHHQLGRYRCLVKTKYLQRGKKGMKNQQEREVVSAFNV